jgi:thioredoxin 1
MAAAHVTDSNFEQEVLKSEQPVLVDFWAVWCYPCKAQEPIIEELATELAGKIKITKMEVDDNPNVPGKYNVLSIPTLALFKGGEIVWQGVGVHQKQILLDELKKHI